MKKRPRVRRPPDLLKDDCVQLELLNSNPAASHLQLIRCRTCKTIFPLVEQSHRLCTHCHREWQDERQALAKRRTQDGVTAFQLHEYLHALSSGDPTATQWLGASRLGQDTR